MKIASAAIVLAAALGVAGAAFAQSSIAPGQTASGQLSSSDPTLDDDSHYDCFALKTRQGVRYRITLSSPAFDAYLAVGRESCAADPEESDDDSGGGTDSQLDLTGDGQVWYVRANSLSANQTGGYQLSVSELGAAPQSPKGGGNQIAWGQTLQGRLSDGDPLASDDSFYDCYVFSGRAGQSGTAEMRSADFDAYLGFFRGGSCDGEHVDSNDDGAGGTDSRLAFTLPADGLYALRANSLSARMTGAYSLTLTGGGGSASAAPNPLEREACIYRQGSQRLEAGRGVIGEGTLIIDGAETALDQAGATQAEGRSWFVNSRPVRIGGRNYVKYGLPRVLGFAEVEYFAEHDGVVFAVETGLDEARPEVLYALVRTVGCEFQPYQIEG